MTNAEHVSNLEAQSRLQAAFPWAVRLEAEQRERFARELADHPKGATDRELDELIGSWKAIATPSTARRRLSSSRAA